MKFKLNITYLLTIVVASSILSGCYKEVDCASSSSEIAPPVPQAKFRLIDHQGRDLFAANTPNNVQFSNLKAVQPCTGIATLGKHIQQIGAGGLESYVIFFDNMRQPVTGENQECFTVILDTGSGNNDTIEFISRSEHHNCGTTYYLDEVKFNGVTTQKDANGYYLLQK